MNVRAAAGPEPNASTEQLEPQLTQATEDTPSAIADTPAGEDPGDKSTSFEDRMRAQLALITAPSESDASTSADPKTEESADCTGIVSPDETGKFAERKPALPQRLSNRPNRVAAETRVAPGPSRLHHSNRQNSSATTRVDRAGSLTAESVALPAPWIGCEPAARTMDNPTENAIGANSFDRAQIAKAAQPVSPTLTTPSKPGVLAGNWSLNSNVAASGGHSKVSSPIVESGQFLPAQNSISGEQEKSTGISTQANFALGVLTNEGEQRANDSRLTPSHANSSSLTIPLAANNSGVGKAIEPDTKARAYGEPSLVESSDTKTPPAAVRSQTSDSVPASLSASDQPMPISTPSVPENGKMPRSFRPSTADEQIKAFSPAHSDPVHAASHTNGNAIFPAEPSPISAVPSRSSHEQNGRFHINDAFAAIESGATLDPAYRTVQHGGRFQAEAGFQDPSLGWIGVRAETRAGALHATVLSSSTEAAQALSGHIAGLHAYLADRNAPVQSLTLVSTGSPGDQAATLDSREGTHQGAGNQGGRDNTSQASQEILQSRTTRSLSSPGAAPPELAQIHSLGNSIGGRISVLA